VGELYPSQEDAIANGEKKKRMMNDLGNIRMTPRLKNFARKPNQGPSGKIEIRLLARSETADDFNGHSGSSMKKNASGCGQSRRRARVIPDRFGFQSPVSHGNHRCNADASIRFRFKKGLRE
jgi:hypothetical protein